MIKVILLCILLAASATCQKTVEQASLDGRCSTTVVQGLSEQLIDEMLCLSPDVMKSIAGYSKINLGSSVFPWLQKPAADALINAVSNAKSAISLNSALRTLPQQLLLYRWYNLGLCGITAAAAPGHSNHNGGLAIDINNYSAWKSTLSAYGWAWFGSSDKVHYDFKGSGTKDIRALSVKAFQVLWNLNNPNDKIAEDGIYGPNTERRLLKSPVTGFPRGSTCSSKRSVIEERVTTCTANGVPGTCIDQSDCTGTVTPGLCPGAVNIKCCTNPAPQDVDSCKISSGASGICKDKTTCTSAGGTTYAGYCPGPNNIQCCIASGGGGGGGTTGQHVNDAGVSLIKSYEGYYANFYIDPVGIKTVGYGHACHVFDCSNLQAKNSAGQWRQVFAPLSKADAADLLRGDLEKGGYEQCVSSRVTTSINSNQFSALTSFVFNVGCGNFASSTLLKRVNQRAAVEGPSGIRDAFLMWNKAGGKVLNGLTKRRNAEADLYGGTTSRSVTAEELDFERDAASATVICPDDSVYDPAITFCATSSYVFGPFPDAMVNKCIALGGKSQCTDKVAATVNGISVYVLKWKRSLALDARGDGVCPLGTVQDENANNECVEFLGDPDTGYTRMAIYGGIPSDVADACNELNGGSACYTTRWSMKYFMALYSPPGLQYISDENGTVVEDGEDDEYAESGNQNLPDQQVYSIMVTSPGCDGVCFSTAAAVGIGAGILAAIIIAVVIFVALSVVGGKKGYDVWVRNRNSMHNPQPNALYKDEGRSGKNPFYAQEMKSVQSKA